MCIYIPLCRYWIALYRYVLVFIVPRVDIELEDNKQFISNIPRILATGEFGRPEAYDYTNGATSSPMKVCNMLSAGSYHLIGCWLGADQEYNLVFSEKLAW